MAQLVLPALRSCMARTGIPDRQNRPQSKSNVYLGYVSMSKKKQLLRRAISSKRERMVETLHLEWAGLESSVANKT